MTAIDSLLEAAGKLGEAGMTGWAPLLEEIASVHTSIVEALLPFLAATAIDMEPFRYGFQLPPGQPELKPESAEPAGDATPPAVNIGPVNVYAIAREIKRAMEDLEQETTSVPDIFSSYASPGRMTKIEAPSAGAPPSFIPAAAWPSSHAPEEEPVRQAPEHSDTARRRPSFPLPVDDGTATGLPLPASAAGQTATAEPGAGRRAQEWIEPGMKRSLVALGELHEAYRSIVWPSAGQAAAGISDALSVAPAASAAVARVPGFPAGTDEAHVPGKTAVTPTHPPANDGPAFEADGKVAAAPGLDRAKAPKKTVMVPPIMPRPPASPFTAEPAESAAINARRLAEALASSFESVRPPSLQTARGQAEETPAARAEWPRGPAAVLQQAPEPELVPAGMPVTSVARSFAAMGNYVRAAAGMGLMAIPDHDGQGTPVSLAPGSALMSAMTSEAPPVVLPSPAASPPAPLSGYMDTGTGALPARGTAQWLAPAAGLAAAQAMQRSGLSAVQQLLLSAPRVPGDPGHLAAPSMSPDLGRGMSWAMPASPVLASGAESIVNITVPPPQPGRTVESTATTRVSNFHNTFNISVTVKGGEERDLKELGKKIGQILSDEIKRYGEI